ncbi:MAG TPA: electron transfer flavoprotein subunit beta/FixA family protein [Nocardioidaceae bacterium]|nr:electron transfer flavoprotein subunit beta/FixA family protein [Nocardioidaceae bacterium]
MNIVVCVKYVPDASADRRFEADNTVDRVGVDGLLSELDEYAVEQALQLKEKLGDDTQVTVLSVGPDGAGDAIRKALQMGADKGVHVVDDAIAGSDALGTSLVLAEALKRATWDLVICGMTSTDGAMGVLPAMLGERLGVPALTFGSSLTVEGGKATIRRDGDVATETIEASLPAVVSVTDQSGEARYPSFKGIMAAKKKDVLTFSLGDLGVSADQVGLSASWTAVEGTEARPPRTAGEIVKDEDGSGAKALAEFLASKKFI